MFLPQEPENPGLPFLQLLTVFGINLIYYTTGFRQYHRVQKMARKVLQTLSPLFIPGVKLGSLAGCPGGFGSPVRAPKGLRFTLRTERPLFREYQPLRQTNGHERRYRLRKPCKLSIFHQIADCQSVRLRNANFTYNSGFCVHWRQARFNVGQRKGRCNEGSGKKTGLPYWRRPADLRSQTFSRQDPGTAGNAGSAHGPWHGPYRGRQRPPDFSASGR